MHVPSALAQSRVSVPEGCGTPEEFGRDIERLTGAPAERAAAAEVSIGRLAGGAYELRLTLLDEQRTLRDPDCRVLWRSALVIVAAASRGPAADPAAGEEPAAEPVTAAPAGAASVVPPGVAAPLPAPSTPEPAASAPPVAAGVRAAAEPSRRALDTAPVRRRVARPRRARVVAAEPESLQPSPELDADAAREGSSGASGGLRWGLGAAAGVSGGVVPGLSPALELSAQLESLPWAGALALRYWPERSTQVGGRGVDVSALGARGAVLFRVAAAVNVLAGLELTRLTGSGAVGVSDRNADAAWQLAPTLGASAIVWDIGHLRLELGVAGRVSLLRPRFVVTGFGDLYRAPALGGDAIIRGVWLFP